MTPRIPALPPKEWPPEMREALAVLRPETRRHPALTTEGDRPKGLNALGTLANHVELTRAFHTFTGHLLYNTTMTLRHRELVILRVAHLRACEYEWLQHVVIGRDVGITTDEIDAVRAGELPDALETALLRATDELIAHARIGDDTWAVLRAGFDTQQLMDLVFTVGNYDLLAMALLSFDVAVDDDLRR